MSQPEIGRPVHYVSYGSADGKYPSTCRAALVTENHGGNLIGLVIFSPNGMHTDRSVPYSEDHDGGSWHWPELSPTWPVEKPS